MKFGDMESDIKLNCTAKNFLGYYTKGAFVREGKRLLKKHPEYEYLKEDPWLTHEKNFDKKEFYGSVVDAYMIDCILKQKPELNDNYKNIIQKHIKGWHKKRGDSIYTNADKAYSFFNHDFLVWYSDYLREQADPGILEREYKEWEAKNKALQAAHDARKRQEQQQLQQDLADGTRVICPYCKSADTKKLTALNRAVSVSLVGAASGKIGKQWHCNHCGSDF